MNSSILFTPRGSLRGQTTIYLFSTLAMLMLLALWLFDSNTLIVSSIRAQNAADASALAAAQWQARSLNAIGEINLIKAINNLLDTANIPPGDVQGQLTGVYTNDYTTVQLALDSLQARLTFEGPVLAMLAAQQAAKNNGAPVNSEFTQIVRTHATKVDYFYADNFSSGGWNDPEWAKKYAQMLNFLADEGIAVINCNPKFYNSSFSTGAEELYTEGFYTAIQDKDWCYVENLLIGPSPYTDYTYWGTISQLPQAVFGCEFFNLGLRFDSAGGVNAGLTPERLDQLKTTIETKLDERSLPLIDTWPSFNPQIQWCVFATNLVYGVPRWGEWTLAQKYRVSFVADVIPKYNYSGCDAWTSVSISCASTLALTNHSAGWTSWLVGSGNQQAFASSVGRVEGAKFAPQGEGAAKPFGSLPGINDPVQNFKVVLPVFEAVRLIPRGLASPIRLLRANVGEAWLIHVQEHLPLYTQNGPSTLDSGCFYCSMLQRWEDPSFRQEGIDWLNETDIDGNRIHPCEQPGGGPGPGTGGLPYGG